MATQRGQTSCLSMTFTYLQRPKEHEAGYNDSLNNNLSAYMDQFTQASSAVLGPNQ